MKSRGLNYMTPSRAARVRIALVASMPVLAGCAVGGPAGIAMSGTHARWEAFGGASVGTPKLERHDLRIPVRFNGVASKQEGALPIQRLDCSLDGDEIQFWVTTYAGYERFSCKG